MTNPDPAPAPDDAMPSWLRPVQIAMVVTFVLGTIVSSILGATWPALAAFGIDAVILVWLMQQPWAKKLLTRK